MEQNKMVRQRAQSLRKNMTKEERHLWYDFLKNYDVQFKRQYTLGPYIVDFFCYSAKLVVELDGSQHCEPEAIDYDRCRTAFLQQQGYMVLRFSNRDVMAQFQGVCSAIDAAVKNGCVAIKALIRLQIRPSVDEFESTFPQGKALKGGLP